MKKILMKKILTKKILMKEIKKINASITNKNLLYCFLYIYKND